MGPTPAPYYVLIVVSIYFDPWSDETGWTLTDETGRLVYVDVPFGRYEGEDYVQKQVWLETGRNYIFTIKDQGGNGIIGPDMAMYDITLRDRGRDIRLVEGDGSFQSQRKHTFRIPYRDEYPEPPASPPKITNTWQGEARVKVQVVIIFDDWHEETSWKITDINEKSKVYAEAKAGKYRYGDDITEEIYLAPNKSYIFTISDTYSDGIGIQGQNVYFVILEGSEYKKNPVELVKGTGNFGRSASHTFRVPPLPTRTRSPTKPPSPYPTPVPTEMPSPFPSAVESQHPTSWCVANHEFCIIPHQCCSRRCVNNQCKLSAEEASYGRDSLGGRPSFGGTRGAANGEDYGN